VQSRSSEKDGCCELGPSLISKKNPQSSSHHECHQPITAANPSNVHTATKRAVATDVDPSGAYDTSPV
jgi:hypothetical protein